MIPLALPAVSTMSVSSAGSSTKVQVPRGGSHEKREATVQFDESSIKRKEVSPKNESKGIFTKVFGKKTQVDKTSKKKKKATKKNPAAVSLLGPKKPASRVQARE